MGAFLTQGKSPSGPFYQSIGIPLGAAGEVKATFG
jgi:hypothetical protein